MIPLPYGLDSAKPCADRNEPVVGGLTTIMQDPLSTLLAGASGQIRLMSTRPPLAGDRDACAQGILQRSA